MGAEEAGVPTALPEAKEREYKEGRCKGQG